MGAAHHHHHHQSSEITGIHKLPLYGALGVVVFAVVIVAFSVITGQGKVSASLGDPIAERTVHFRNDDGGVVSVLDAHSGEIVTQFGVGEGAFLRTTVRSMTLNRTAKGVHYSLPYRIVRTDTGQLSIVDPETNHFIQLKSFGPVATSSFSKILPKTGQAGA